LYSGTRCAADTVSLLSFGDAGFGDDDTTVFQNALDSTAANGQVLEIPAGSYNISPIYFPSGANVQCDAGVTVNANDGYGRVAIMLNLAANNITLTGVGGSVDPSVSTCVFQMPLVFAQSSNDGSEYRHCMAIYGGADNVNVSGIACNHAGGDGSNPSGFLNVTNFFHRQFRLCGRQWKVVWERGSRQFYKRDRHKPIYRWDGRSACWWQCGRWSIGLRWIELLSRKCPLLTNKREQHQWKHVLLFRPLRQRHQL
jgi:hypothetical protein